jgi:D-apionolactonase
MTSSDHLVALYGTNEPPEEPARLVAGPLSADLVGGNLRSILFDGEEVVRAIGYIVRDEDWGTYAPLLDELTVEGDGVAFKVSYRARCVGATGASLVYRASISGRPDGIRFEVQATAEADFLTNRCGFCLLHPIIGVAGAPVEVENVDGTIKRSVFPDLIEPWQPFKEIRALTHNVRPGLRATCRLEGDAFEMEDQRNWSDASYKTYVRPLALPWPYLLPAGEMHTQTFTLALAGDLALRRPAWSGASAGDVVNVRIGAPAGRMPAIGLVISPEETPATIAGRERLAEIGPQGLICHFDPTAGHGAEAMAGFAELARLCPAEITLECVVPCSGDLDGEMGEAARLVGEAGLRLSAIAVCPAADRQSTPPGSEWPACPPLEAVYAAARRAFSDLRLGGGMFSYFTEINRKRPPLSHLDFVTHCTCPIVHAADDLSVMQTLEALPFIARSARAIIGEKAYRIGPSTIGMRQNPYGSRIMENPDRKRIAMARSDPRQAGLFAAAWTIGYAARLVDAGIEMLTPAALSGHFGVIAGAGEIIRPGERRPIFHAVKGLAALAGAQAFACDSDRQGRMLGIAARGQSGAVIAWIANLTPECQRLRIATDTGDTKWRAHLLGEASLIGAGVGEIAAFPAITNEPVELPPFAVLRVEAPA